MALTTLFAAMLGLMFWLGIDSSPELTPPAQQVSSLPAATSNAPPSVPRPLDSAATGAVARRPTIPTYKVGNVTIHDSRVGAARITEPPDFARRAPVHLSPDVAQQVTTIMEAPARDCSQSLPAPARADRAKLNVTMTVSVKNGSLTVTDVAAAVQGLDPAVLQPTLTCLRTRMIGNIVDAAGQPDVPSYLISTYYSAQ
jgi:hypothetical protein